jgi:uncharacterized protein YnzC (UPF0291/DUF896 family)
LTAPPSHSPASEIGHVEFERRGVEARLNELMARAVTDELTDDEKSELTTRLEVIEELREHQLDTLYKEV